jgi:hypothetical protein
MCSLNHEDLGKITQIHQNLKMSTRKNRKAIQQTFNERIFTFILLQKINGYDRCKNSIKI